MLSDPTVKRVELDNPKRQPRYVLFNNAAQDITTDINERFKLPVFENIVYNKGQFVPQEVLKYK